MSSRLIGYTRVSTAEQARQGLSLGVQENKIRGYCDVYGHELIGIFTDEGISAKDIKHRPGMIRVIEALERDNNVDGMIMFKLDRAFRNTREALEISERVRKQGKRLISVTESIDTHSAMGRFFFTLTAAYAAMERELTSERVTAILQDKKANGGRVSRHAPYGFRHEGDRIVMDSREQDTIEQVRRLAAKGQTLREISRSLAKEGYLNRQGRPFSASTIQRLVSGHG